MIFYETKGLKFELLVNMNSKENRQETLRISHKDLQMTPHFQGKIKLNYIPIPVFRRKQQSIHPKIPNSQA